MLIFFTSERRRWRGWLASTLNSVRGCAEGLQTHLRTTSPQVCRVSGSRQARAFHCFYLADRSKVQNSSPEILIWTNMNSKWQTEQQCQIKTLRAQNPVSEKYLGVSCRTQQCWLQSICCEVEITGFRQIEVWDIFGQHRHQQQIVPGEFTEAHQNSTLLSCHEPLSGLWWQQETLIQRRTPPEWERTKGLSHSEAFSWLY